MPQEPLPERPKLDKEPVAFLTVKDAGVGAVLGAGVGVVVSLLDMAIDKKPFSGRQVGMFSAIVAAGSALGTNIRSWTRNDERAKTKPYVERLEQELLAKNAVATTPPQL